MIKYHYKEGTIIKLCVPGTDAYEVMDRIGIVTEKEATHGLPIHCDGFNVDISGEVWRVSDIGYYEIIKFYPEEDDYYSLSEEGKYRADSYIKEMEAERKKLLDSGKDTADETELPTIEDIQSDINWWGADSNGEYLNGWNITDNSTLDYPLLLKVGRDLYVSKAK